MRLVPKLVLAAVVGGAALTAAAFAGASANASSQDRCSASDTDCRLTRIEASLARIERALASSTGSSATGVSIATDQVCVYADCQYEARAACRSAGFSRGVPSDIVVRSEYPSHTLRRATCLD